MKKHLNSFVQAALSKRFGITNMCYKYMKMTYSIILLTLVPDNRNLKCRLKFSLMHLQKSQFIYSFSLLMNAFPHYYLSSVQVVNN